jgi:hypothetical protein
VNCKLSRVSQVCHNVSKPNGRTKAQHIGIFILTKIRICFKFDKYFSYPPHNGDVTLERQVSDGAGVS